MKEVGGTENFLALCKDERSLAVMDHGRGQKPQAGMAMLVVVPGKEGLAKCSTVLDRSEASVTNDPGMNDEAKLQSWRLRGSTIMAMPGTVFLGFYGGLHPVYVLGEAYLAAHRGAEAAAEFQKILDHRMIAFADPIAALAHLQLARAFVMMGDKTKAKSAYEDFLTLWKRADSEVPVLVAAKKEFARL